MKKGFVEEYLRSKVVAPTTINAVFKKIAPFERKFKKDVSEFNEREVLDMYQKVIVDIGKGETFCRKNDEEFCIKIGEDKIYMKDSLMEIYIRIL